MKVVFLSGSLCHPKTEPSKTQAHVNQECSMQMCWRADVCPGVDFPCGAVNTALRGASALPHGYRQLASSSAWLLVTNRNDRDTVDGQSPAPLKETLK